MLTEDFLNLRLVRLEGARRWGRQGEGVCFLFPRAGLGQYQNTSSKQPLSPGDVLVVSGEAADQICPGNRGEFVFSSFSLRLDHLLPLFAGTEISLLQVVIDGFKGHKFYPASSPLAAGCHKLVGEIPPQFNLDHRGQLLRVAAAILNEEFNTAHGQRVGFVRAEDHLVQVFEQLSADEMLTLSVDQLADRFGCSRRHLNRLFHQYFGFSVAHLRMEMRLMKAISLLRNGEAKVIHVAEQCGFNHLGLFNTCFRRRFGTSPGQWRKASQEQENTTSAPAKHLDCPLRMSGLCPWPVGASLGNGRPTVSAKGAPKRKLGSAPLPAGFKVAVAAAQKVNQTLPFQVRAQQ